MPHTNKSRTNPISAANQNHSKRTDRKKLHLRQSLTNNATAQLVFEPLENRCVLAAAPLLPDLFPWADESQGFLHDWVVEGDLLRFTTAFANQGAGHLELRGGEVLANGNQVVNQRVFNDDGTFSDRVAGEFTYHPGHGHIHFDGYAIYNLRERLVGGGVGDIVATGGKISFCLIDIARYDSNAGSSRYNSCGQIQGVTAGWSDVYDRNLPDQWVNVGTVPDGDYWLEVIIDPDNLLLESDTSNNTALIEISLNRGGPTQGDQWEPNNTFATATNFGMVSERHDTGLSIHNATDRDHYLVTAAEDGEFGVHVNFTHALGDLNLYVYDQAQNLITSSTGDHDNEHLHFDVLEGESYFIVVQGLDGASNGYDLELHGPGHIITEIVEGTGVPISIPDGLGANTAGPWIHVTLPGPQIGLSDLNLVFGRLDHSWLGDLQFQLTSPQGTVAQVLTSQWQPGGGLLESQDNFLNTVLDDQAPTNIANGNAPYSGSYRINHANTGANPLSVFNGEDASGTWTLSIRDWYSSDVGTLHDWSIVFTGVDLNPGDLYEPNEFFPQAVDLGMLGQSTRDNLSIHRATDRDFFRFQAGAAGATEIRAGFSHAVGNLDLIVYNSSLLEIARSDSTTDNEEIILNAISGDTYYIEVFGVQGALNQYSLDVIAAPQLGETGWINSLTDQWQTIVLSRPYINPVVIVSPLSFNDTTAATVRIRNVTSTSFDVQVDRWDYLPSSHGPETVSYFVVESGRHVLADGSVLEAGIVGAVNQSFQRVGFSEPFAGQTVVLTQVAGNGTGSALTPRLTRVTQNEFDVRIQAQQFHGFVIPPQPVHWIGMTRSTNFSGTTDYQAGLDKRATHQITTSNFSQNFSQIPVLLASVQSYWDSDPVSVRISDLKSNKLQYFLQEEQSRDTETNHRGEVVAWLAIDGRWIFGQRPPQIPRAGDSLSADGLSPLTQAIDRGRQLTGANAPIVESFQTLRSDQWTISDKTINGPATIEPRIRSIAEDQRWNDLPVVLASETAQEHQATKSTPDVRQNFSLTTDLDSYIEEVDFDLI